MTYFGNSAPKIYTSQEDYKPVIICEHCCQIPIYTAVMLVSCQLQIIQKTVHTRGTKMWKQKMFCCFSKGANIPMKLTINSFKI